MNRQYCEEKLTIKRKVMTGITG